MAARATTGGRGGAKDRALHHVKEQILSGAFPGGELISEGEVAEALAMSRTPVREAFLRLEAEGLLRLYPQRGALVVPVSAEEVRAVLEARLVLETFALGKVVGQGSEARERVLAGLDEELARQHDAARLQDRAGFVHADRAFHTWLLTAAGNPILATLYSSLRDRQLRMVSESAERDPGRAEAILAEHARIAEATRAGDLDGARAAVRDHLAGTLRSLGLTAGVDAPGG